MGYLDNKLVFLAGATGLAGSSILNDILDNYPKTNIRACYYKHTRPFIKHKRIQYIFGDLKMAKDCQRVTKGCDCAIMVAAETGGAQVNVAEPWRQINDNATMNIELLRALSLNNVRRLVCAGSAALYQEFDGQIRESDLDLNKDPYPAYFGIGWVTRFVEKVCQFWHQQSGMEIVMVRSTNIFGPYAKFNPLTSNFIPALIRKAVDKMDPFEVWGSPEVTRDVIYSEDFARAILMMLEAESIKFDVFNVGSGVKTTVGNVVQWALKYAGHNPKEIKYLVDRPSTIKFRAVDCSRAKESLNWQPHYSVEEGISKTTEWWIKNRGRWCR